MKITIENTDTKTPYASKRIASIETEHDDLDIFGMMEEIKSVLVAYGFHSKTVEDGILQAAEEIEVAINNKQETSEKFSEGNHN